MTYFTSDQHFGHFNIIRLSHRPFASVDEMDEAMAAKWNAKVKASDTIYVLGDLFFRSANVEPILKRLNGRKQLVLGNHDHSWTGKVRLGDYFESVQTMKEIDACGAPATLCHYPMLSYPQARRGYIRRLRRIRKLPPAFRSGSVLTHHHSFVGLSCSTAPTRRTKLRQHAERNCANTPNG